MGVVVLAEEQNKSRHLGIRLRLVAEIALLSVFVLMIVGFAVISLSSEVVREDQRETWVVRNRSEVCNLDMEIVKWERIVGQEARRLELDGRFEPDEIHRKISLFMTSVGRDGHVYDVAFTTADGRVYSAGGLDISLGFTTQMRDAVLRSVNTTGVYISPPFLDHASEKTVIALTHSVVVGGGRTVGALSLLIYLPMLVRDTTPDLPQGAYSFLVDADGGILSHHSRTYSSFMDGALSNIHNAGGGNYAPIEAVIGGSERFVKITDYDRVQRACFASPAADGKWFLVTAVPMEHVQLRVSQMQTSLLQTFTVALLFSLIASFLISTSMIAMAREDVVNSMNGDDTRRGTN